MRTSFVSEAARGSADWHYCTTPSAARHRNLAGESSGASDAGVAAPPAKSLHLSFATIRASFMMRVACFNTFLVSRFLFRRPTYVLGSRPHQAAVPQLRRPDHD